MNETNHTSLAFIYLCLLCGYKLHHDEQHQTYMLIVHSLELSAALARNTNDDPPDDKSIVDCVNERMLYIFSQVMKPEKEHLAAFFISR